MPLSNVLTGNQLISTLFLELLAKNSTWESGEEERLNKIERKKHTFSIEITTLSKSKEQFSITAETARETQVITHV